MVKLGYSLETNKKINQSKINLHPHNPTGVCIVSYICIFVNLVFYVRMYYLIHRSDFLSVV